MAASSDEASLVKVAPFAKLTVIPSYNLEVSLNFTKARSSFCRDTPVNWAITILLNPAAFLPSARRPFIPHTERIEQLKIYGEAPDTVSVSIVTVAAEALGDAGRFGLTYGSK